jgi:hypothetical protein
MGGHRSFTEMRPNYEDTPIPAIRAIEIRPPKFYLATGGLVRDERPCRGTA